jgi:hypothetical protein
MASCKGDAIFYASTYSSSLCERIEIYDVPRFMSTSCSRRSLVEHFREQLRQDHLPAALEFLTIILLVSLCERGVGKNFKSP